MNPLTLFTYKSKLSRSLLTWLQIPQCRINPTLLLQTELTRTANLTFYKLSTKAVPCLLAPGEPRGATLRPCSWSDLPASDPWPRGPGISLLRVLTHTCSQPKPRPPKHSCTRRAPPVLWPPTEGRLAAQPKRSPPNPFPLCTGPLGVLASGEGFPRACRGEAWAALGTRGLVQGASFIQTPHAARCPRPSPATWLWLTPASQQRAGAPKTRQGARPRTPRGPHRALGGRWHGVPAAAGDQSCRQREAGRKEERAQGQPLRRAARTTAAEQAGRAPGGTCAQAARPAPPRPASPPAPPIGPSGREAGAGWEGPRARERAGAGGGGRARGPGSRSARLPRSQCVGFSAPQPGFSPGARPAWAAHALFPACGPTLHPLDPGAPHPAGPPGDGSPEGWRTAVPAQLDRHGVLRTTAPARLPFPITFFSQSTWWEAVKQTFLKEERAKGSLWSKNSWVALPFRRFTGTGSQNAVHRANPPSPFPRNS